MWHVRRLLAQYPRLRKRILSVYHYFCHTKVCYFFHYCVRIIVKYLHTSYYFRRVWFGMNLSLFYWSRDLSYHIAHSVSHRNIALVAPIVRPWTSYANLHYISSALHYLALSLTRLGICCYEVILYTIYAKFVAANSNRIRLVPLSLYPCWSITVHANPFS